MGSFERENIYQWNEWCTDLAVSPDCAGDGEEGGGGLEPGHGPAQPLVTHLEAEAAPVHVEDHGEGVRHRPAVMTSAQTRGEMLTYLE